MANKDNQPFDVPDPEAAGWKEDPDRPGYWLWDTEQPVTEAPEDGKQYGRQDASWTEITHPTVHWNGGSGGISTNASKAIVGQENTEGAGLYASGKIEVWESAQNNNYVFAGYGAGSLTSHIQADGDAKFAGNVDLLGVGRYGRASLGFDTNVVFGRGSNDLPTGVDLGNDSYKWNNATFAGTVNAASFVGDGSQLTGIDVDLTGYAKYSDDPAPFVGEITSATHLCTTGTQYGGFVLRRENGRNVASLSGLTETNDNGCLTLYNGVSKGAEIRASGDSYVSGALSWSGGNSTNANTAYSWGDHSTAGYVNTSSNQTIGGAKTFSSNVTAPDFVATSDERLKKNVETVQTGLIDQIRGVEFEYIETNDRRAGVIAQEVEAVDGLSHLVWTNEDEDKTKSVSYLGLIPYLIEEIKALKAEVKVLKDAK